MTNGNPLKGFVTNIVNWGPPANDFPLSMEFAYVPLSALLVSEGQYDFENGFEPIVQVVADRNHHLILGCSLTTPTSAADCPAI